jgi:hypothetical protein
MAGYGMGPGLGDPVGLKDVEDFAAVNTSWIDSALQSTQNAFMANPTSRAVEDLAAGGRQLVPSFKGSAVLESDDQIRARGDTPLDETQWKASPSYREGLNWDYRMTSQRAAAIAAQHDTEAQRAEIASRSTVGNIVGMFAGSAADPLNFLPVFGEVAQARAATRFGELGARILVGAGDAAVGTALGDVVAAPARQAFGDDTSLEATLYDVGIGALLGGAFGAAGHAFARYGEGKAVRAREATEIDVRNTEDAAWVMSDAVRGLKEDGEVNLSQRSMDAMDEVFDREAARAIETDVSRRVDERVDARVDERLSEEVRADDTPAARTDEEVRTSDTPAARADDAGRVGEAVDAERPVRVAGPPPEPAPPEVMKEAAANVGKPSTEESLKRDFRLDRNDEDVALKKLETSGRTVDKSSIERAETGATTLAAEHRALEVALNCQIGG